MGVIENGTEQDRPGIYSVLKEIRTPSDNAVNGSTYNPLEYAIAVSYYNVSFPEGYEITLDMPDVISLENMFMQAKGLKKVTIKGNKSGNALNMNYLCASCTSNKPHPIEVIDFTDFNLKISTCDYAFYGASNLREIKGLIDLSQCTSAMNVFYNCTALEDFRLVPLCVAYGLEITSTDKLSAKTRQSIVEALNPVGGVLKLHSEVVMKFTQEQLTEIINKNWRIQ